MGIKNRGSTTHPSRVSGQQKFVHNLELQREAEKTRKKDTFKPVDISKPNWSTRKNG